MSNVRTCAHIKVNGVRCGSPALRGESYCYFHYRMLCESRISHVALLENEEAIQVSIMEIVNSLLRGTIELKRGELVLRALNIAVRNSRRARFEDVSNMICDLPKEDLPKDPVVPPRPLTVSREELQAATKAMLAASAKPAVSTPNFEPDVTRKKPSMSVKQVISTQPSKVGKRKAAHEH